MDANPMSGHEGNQSTPNDATLRRIADLLGVPVAGFYAPERSRLLHTDPDGAVWVLMTDPQSMPVVSYIADPAAGQQVTQESIAAFLARDPNRRPQQALLSLIERLLITHLAA